MEIGPVNNGKTAVNRPGGLKDQEELTEKKDCRADDVRISAEARERFQAGEATEGSINDQEKPAKDISDCGPDMLRLIRQRLDGGYYERASVKDETLNRLIDEMLENINQFYKY